MSIDIQEIKIILDTNIPGKPTVTLTKGLLYNPELKNMNKFNEYPYFTMDTKFNERYLDSLTYEKKLEFFFNKDEMMRTFKKEKVVVQNEEIFEIKTKTRQETERKIDELAKSIKELEVNIKNLDKKIRDEEVKNAEIIENKKREFNDAITFLKDVNGNEFQTIFKFKVTNYKHPMISSLRAHRIPEAI